MRELKFRVWDTIAKEWATSLKLKPNGHLEDLNYDSEGFYRFEPDPDQYVIELCTGLKDKNGKEIYEGDILHSKVGKDYIVSYSNDGGRYEMWSKDGYGGPFADALYIEEFKMEIIGNIHENPELLERRKHE